MSGSWNALVERKRGVVDLVLAVVLLAATLVATPGGLLHPDAALAVDETDPTTTWNVTPQELPFPGGRSCPAGSTLIKDQFKGPSAIAISFDDPVAPAKVLVDFSKENDKLELKGGVLGGKVVDVDGLKALSSLPSKEVLLAQVLSTMNAVPTALVTALSDVPRRMLNVLQAIKDQKEAQA